MRSSIPLLPDTFEIRWRPSGGRGEYEYIARTIDVRDKRVVVQVPIVRTRTETDVTCRFLDGKPRLRREDANNRDMLNVPPLVAAMAGLPEPARSKQLHTAYPLSDKGYAVNTITFDVVEVNEIEVVVEPTSILPDGLVQPIDLGLRLQSLITASATEPSLADFLARVSSGDNSKELAKLAALVHLAHPANVTGVVPIVEETDDFVLDFAGREGREVIRVHRLKERNSLAVQRAKEAFRQRHGHLYCECCRVDFSQRYPGIGDGFIEAHHRDPLGGSAGERDVRPEDFVMLCPNCHRMVHRTANVSVKAVREALEAGSDGSPRVDDEGP